MKYDNFKQKTKYEAEKEQKKLLRNSLMYCK